MPILGHCIRQSSQFGPQIPLRHPSLSLGSICALAERDAAAATDALSARSEKEIWFNDRSSFQSCIWRRPYRAYDKRRDKAQSAFTAARAEQEKIDRTGRVCDRRRAAQLVAPRRPRARCRRDAGHDVERDHGQPAPVGDPDRLLGRVNSVYRFFGWGAIPIGALLGGAMVAGLDGPLSREWALRMPWIIAGAAQLVLAVVVVRTLTQRPHRRRAGRRHGRRPGVASGPRRSR